MAWMNQEKKKVIAAMLKERLKGKNVKYSLSVVANMSICCRITAGDAGLNAVCPDREETTVNQYRINEWYTGEAREILNIIRECLNHGNWDRSDVQTDYFDVGHYIDIKVGKYDKPFVAI